MPSASTKSTSHAFQTDDAGLRPIHEKIIAQQALDAIDVTALYASKDILAIGWMANHVRERMHGNATRYAVHTITANAADAGEYVVLAEELGTLFRKIESLKRSHPQSRVVALTVEEVAAHGHPENLITDLRHAGADGLIGHGAEVFLPALRKRIWKSASSAQQRAEVRRHAKELSLAVPFYLLQRGATPEQQAAELLTFRDFPADSFAAISFDPDATTSLHINVTTGMQEMKQIAIARLALDNVAHIRAYWQMLGGKLLQIALRFGASELDGTPLDAAENLGERKHEVAREIQVAGQTPQEIPSVWKTVVLA